MSDIHLDAQERVIQSYIDGYIEEPALRAELKSLGFEDSWIVDLLDEVNRDIDRPVKCRQCGEIVEGTPDGCEDWLCPMKM